MHEPALFALAGILTLGTRNGPVPESRARGRFACGGEAA